ncbi:MAG: hypothetical protein KIH62_002825 [Candidatus Kerfeldbacteria bacterium]|nr:hypothetical protein [Candidatus Kerfeldbacteria bacterium]
MKPERTARPVRRRLPTETAAQYAEGVKDRAAQRERAEGERTARQAGNAALAGEVGKGPVVFDSYERVLGAIRPGGAMLSTVEQSAGHDAEAATSAFMPVHLRELRKRAGQHAVESGAAEESLLQELDAAAWSSIDVGPAERGGGSRLAEQPAFDYEPMEKIAAGDDTDEGVADEITPGALTDARAQAEQATPREQQPRRDEPFSALISARPPFPDLSRTRWTPQAPATYAEFSTEPMLTKVPAAEQETLPDHPLAQRPHDDTTESEERFTPPSPLPAPAAPELRRPVEASAMPAPEVARAQAPVRALEQLKEATADRERRILTASPWKRRLLAGLASAGAAMGALAAMVVGAYKLHDRWQHDADTVKDLAAEQERSAGSDHVPADLPVAPSAQEVQKNTAENFFVVQDGQGISQALLKAGVKFEPMMDALKGLHIQIGARNPQLKDVFVIARGGELGMKVRTDAEGAVLSITFTHANGSAMTPAELPKYLAVADWRAEKKLREDAASAEPLGSASVVPVGRLRNDTDFEPLRLERSAWQGPDTSGTQEWIDQYRAAQQEPMPTYKRPIERTRGFTVVDADMNADAEAPTVHMGRRVPFEEAPTERVK